MKIQTLNILVLALIASSLSLSSCKKDDDDPDDHDDHNEEELITTVQLQLGNTNNGDQRTAKWSDSDGPGGENPVIDTVYLDTSSTYSVEIEFLDESGAEVADITDEIREEASEHIICFDSSSDNLVISRTDSDGTYEIGLESEWVTTSAGTYNVTISLKHQPDTKDGTCTPGETDVEVEFPVIIQ